MKFAPLFLRQRTFIAAVLPLGLLLLVAPTHSMGQTSIQWINSDGGLFSEVDNWDGDNVPGSNNVASFGASANGTFTVDFNQDHTVHRVLLRFGTAKDITFDLAGNTLDAIGSETAWNDAAFEFRTSDESGPVSLRLENGSVTAGVLTIGAAGDTTDPLGSTLIVGENATLTTSGAGNIGRSQAQIGHFRIENGGRWESETLVLQSNRWWLIGNTADSEGSIVVSGSNSVADLHTDLNVEASVVLIAGNSGVGRIEVRDGGSFTGARVLELGRGETGDGTLLVTGTNSVFSTTDRDIVVGNNGTGLMLVEAGGTASAGRHLDVSGTLTIDNGNASAESSVILRSGAIYNLTLNAKDISPLDADSSFQLQSSVTLNLQLGAGFSADLGDEFVLFTYGGSITSFGEFDGLPQDALIQVGAYEFRIDYGSGTNDYAFLEVTVIPEPAAAAYLIMALFGLCFLSRRCNKK